MDSSEGDEQDKRYDYKWSAEAVREVQWYKAHRLSIVQKVTTSRRCSSLRGTTGARLHLIAAPTVVITAGEGAGAAERGLHEFLGAEKPNTC